MGSWDPGILTRVAGSRFWCFWEPRSHGNTAQVIRTSFGTNDPRLSFAEAGAMLRCCHPIGTLLSFS